MKISMRLIPLASLAVAAIFTEPFLGKVAPLAGFVIVTVGGVVSARVVNVKSELRARLPAASFERTW